MPLPQRRSVPARPALLAGILLAAAIAPQPCAFAQRSTQPLPTSAPHAATPPVAPVREHVAVVHGRPRTDAYYWLRQRGDPDVLAYLEAENAYTAAVMRHTEPLQQRLFEEMKGRIRETDSSVPARDGPYFYYERTEAGRQYPIFCRRADTPDAPEQILLDCNALAEGREHFALGGFEVSPDHSHLAYSVDFTGREQYTLHVKDLVADQTLTDAVPHTYYGLAWASDNRTIFYTTLDDALRPYRVHAHRVGTPAGEDRLIYEEPDERFHVSVRRTRSGACVLIELESQVTTEVRYLPADDPACEPKVLIPRVQGVEYYADHSGDRFYVLTNQDAFNFKLISVPTTDTAPTSWQTVIAHDPAVTLESVDAFADFLAIEERRDGLSGIRIYQLPTGATRVLRFDEPAYHVELGENLEFRTRTLRYEYSSLATPDSVYDLDLETGQTELRKRREIRGHDPADYRTERLWADAPDGTRVPISLVYRRDRRGEGPQPLLLEGYGSYGVSNEPSFDANLVSLLDRGVIYAIAHVRGGGEMGRQWYEDGKLLHKKNTFTDFIACAEHLIAAGYTRPDRLAILGGSAGGLLIGAVLNMRPDLFRCAIAHVPFVDVVNTMLDETIPLTVIEYEEWGNPHEPQYFDYMLSYSPYDNVRPQSYPHMLVTAGLNDPRVQYWEPAKWVARLRAARTGDSLLLLKTNMDAGHAGASGRYDRLREIAFEYAFVLDRLGMLE